MIGIIFARESNRYDKNIYSLKSQVDACLERAKADGVDVAERHIFREQFSGRDLGKMPKLGELRKLLAVSPGRKRVYCYAQDRLFRGRKGYHIFRILSEFDEWETEAFFILDNVDTGTVAGQVQILFKGQKAAIEPDDILDRTMRGKLKRIGEGKIPGFGRNKYGYKRDKETGKAEIVEDEARTVRRFARELLAGVSINEVARRLTMEGAPPPYADEEKGSSRWWTSTITRILRDPAYKGQGIALTRVTVDGRVRRRPENGWIKLPDDCYPPILRPADWERLQSLLDQNRGAQVRNGKRPALLRGLIFCSVCGRPFYLVSNGDRLYYRCSTMSTRVTKPSIPRCPGRPVAAAWIEPEVWREVVAVLSDPARLRAILAEPDGAGEREAEEELRRIRADLAKKDAQEQNLAREMRDATIAVARVIKQELEKIEAERAALVSCEAEILRRRLSHEQRLRKIDEIEALVRKSLKRLPRAKFEQKRIILEELGARVKVSGREFKVVYSIGG